ncbi:hypothetical protein GCM10010924_58680 [Rhizobium wenxiniae]|uniref:Response regulator n=1 Tax=Rhizobium wenxiniae TaxID=1737357 RepID=A0A7W9YCN8_9HYPH|nr:response regulator [Rhizobium wenxiniae]MBB6166187.1 hypothetical protein [Rhizobium wenxiniae]GGG21518.1 hypothetical protein GCM10010924_58680 [Rhizobium wenxiniae]
MENLKPCQKVLIVEDQYLIAMMIEDAVIAAGFDVCGMAACRQDVLDLFDETDIALVDVNVRAGKTGPGIGAELAAAGKTVIFMTGNPEEVSLVSRVLWGLSPSQSSILNLRSFPTLLPTMVTSVTPFALLVISICLHDVSQGYLHGRRYRAARSGRR